MKKLIALVAITLISGSAFAADAQKIVSAKAKVKVAAKISAPLRKPDADSRYDGYRLEAFSCCGLPQ